MIEEEFEIVQGKLEDREEVLQFLCEHFLVEETMNVALRLSKEEFVNMVNDLIPECLSSGYTVLARDKNTSQISGLVLNIVWRRETTHGTKSTIRSANPTPGQIIGVYLDTFADSFWKLVPPTVNAVLHREIVSVGAPWQRKGLGSRLIDSGFNEAELKAHGITGFASKTSSIANQKLMEKKGYRELMSIPFASVLGSDGNPLVVPQDGTTRNVLLWKMIV